jgi:hypothetical protein
MSHSFFSNDINPASSSIEKNSEYYYTPGEEKTIGKVDSENIRYKTNNYGHRSENFTNIHNGKHFLFAGCSFTFGEGLRYKENWSGKLYEMLSKKYKTDEYFSLGFLNGVTSNIIYNIIIYCEKFGSPDVIFCLFPESVRKISYEDKDFFIKYKHDDYHLNLGRLDCFYSIYFLEQYCKAKNIKLLWSTWFDKDNNFYLNKGFKDFIYFWDIDIYINSKNKIEKTDILYKRARDGKHPGLRYSDGVANIFFKELNLRYEE